MRSFIRAHWKAILVIFLLAMLASTTVSSGDARTQSQAAFRAASDFPAHGLAAPSYVQA